MRKMSILIGMGLCLIAVVFVQDQWMARGGPRFTVITHTPSDDLNPVWSPDGQRIAFVGHDEGNPEVYVLELSSGTITNVSNSPLDDYAPLWSPDGQYIAFRRRENAMPYKLAVVEVATGAEVELFMGDSPRPYVWHGQQLVYETTPSFVYCPVVYTVPSRQSQQLTCDPMPITAISPDGHWIIRLNAGMTAWELIDTESGKVRPSPPLADPNEELVNIWDVVWSPDSRTIAYVSDAFVIDSYEEVLRIDLYDLAADTTTFIFELPIPDLPNLLIGGWSPEGQLAWAVTHYPTSNPSFNGQTEFYVVDLTSPSQVRLVKTLDHMIYRLNWSPAGRYLGFSTYAGGYVLDSSTGTLYNYVYDAYMPDIRWSTDGRYFVTGTTVAELRTGRIAVFEREVVWSPDGTQWVIPCGKRLETNLCLIEWP
jgi:dipeptidyl aminopeptidase/acylaminoacyl peptidase